QKPVGLEHLITLRVRRADGEPHEAQIPVLVSEERDNRGATEDGDPDLKLQIDGPRLIDGAVEAPVRGNLEITGWALAKAGVGAIEISVDGKPIALADYGLRRLDIRANFPDWNGALTSGYQALLPHRL